MRPRSATLAMIDHLDELFPICEPPPWSEA